LIDLICQIFNTFLTALCYSHFQRIHKCHHAHTNEMDKDVDAQSGIFSLYPEAVAGKQGAVGRFVTRHQHWLIWPLVSLQGFSLKFDSLHTLSELPRKTRIDQFALVLHLLLWFGIPVYALGLLPAVVNYLLMTWLTGPYLGSIFLPNNLGMYYLKPGERMPYLHQQLITTRNLGTSKLSDVLFGGLNHHIEHHLFPTVSMYKLRVARRITEHFCQVHKLPYTQMSWFQAMVEIFVHLRRVARIATS
jgi:fatty acid desaturase